MLGIVLQTECVKRPNGWANGSSQKWHSAGFVLKERNHPRWGKWLLFTTSKEKMFLLRFLLRFLLCRTQNMYSQNSLAWTECGRCVRNEKKMRKMDGGAWNDEVAAAAAVAAANIRVQVLKQKRIRCCRRCISEWCVTRAIKKYIWIYVICGFEKKNEKQKFCESVTIKISLWNRELKNRKEYSAISRRVIKPLRSSKELN